MSTIIIITPPPPNNPNVKAAALPPTINQHLENVLLGKKDYIVTMQGTGFTERLLGLVKSSTAWFNGLIATASSMLLAFPEMLSAAQGQLSLLSPALDAKQFAYVGFVMGTVSIVLRARSAHRKP